MSVLKRVLVSQKLEATAGFTMTRHANGDLDVGVKGEVTGRVGAAGKNYEGTVTVMEGPRSESKDVIGILILNPGTNSL